MESPPPLGKRELVAQIRAQIEREGPLAFSAFMREALYAPSLGYYSSVPELGARGDFYTAVSAGPLFGRFLAWQLAESWQHLGGPKHFSLIEQGAHRGQMLADLLTELRQTNPDLHQQLDTIVIEPDPTRREVQATTLAAVGGQVRFVSHPTELPTGICGYFIANELVDSFPVDRARFKGGRWWELRVDWDGDRERFIELETSLGPELVALIQQEAPPEVEGFTVELCPELERWFPDLLNRFATGHLLVIDYALTREERRNPARASGTLRTYFQHQLGDDPLCRVGEQDITYHIHGTRLEEIAHGHGWTCVSLDQHRAFAGMIAAFLPEGEERVQSLTPKDRRILQTLVHPAFLGRAFSVFSFRKGWPREAAPPALEAFAPRFYRPETTSP
ncbi:MAG: SAM-dependent methyltransferase [Candidatus Methylacidiphilales bacterium]